MEINENEYIRYIPTNGYTVIISKVTKIKNCMFDNAYYLDDSKEEVYSSHFDDIIKHSKDIIDLIEVGDYVNGHKVCMDLKSSKKHYNSKDNFITCKDYTFENDEIETVLTKEQFEANAYKIEKER